MWVVSALSLFLIEPRPNECGRPKGWHRPFSVPIPLMPASLEERLRTLRLWKFRSVQNNSRTNNCK